jgi:hypothetical protein
MKKFSGLLIVLMLSFALVGCGYTKETRRAAAVVTPAATTQLLTSSIAINWLVDILEARKQMTIDMYIDEHPDGDPSDIVVMIEMETADGNVELVDIDDVIDSLKGMSKDNLEVAVLLDLLNESIQANQGWNPIAGELELLARDPEFQAMVQAYLEMIRNKNKD